MDKALRWAYAQFLEFPAEKPPSNRFGRYWTEGTGSRRGDRGRPLWFRTAPPPRVGAASPRRWAAEPPPGLRSSKRAMAVVAELTAAVGGNPSPALCKAIERAAMRPYGPRPYELRLVLIRKSQVITDQLK